MGGRLYHPQGPVSAVAVIDEVCPDAAAFSRLLHEEHERIKREQGELEQRADVVRFLELSDRLHHEHPELDLERQVPRLRVHENVNAAVALPRTVSWGSTTDAGAVSRHNTERLPDLKPRRAVRDRLGIPNQRPGPPSSRRATSASHAGHFGAKRFLGDLMKSVCYTLIGCIFSLYSSRSCFSCCSVPGS